MRRRIAIIGGCVIAGTLVGISSVPAKEEIVPREKIPQAVREALLAKFPTAKIDQCAKEQEADETVYDIEFKQDDRKCEADIREDGTFINYELAIDAKMLPQAVREALDKRYVGATLKEIMEETEVTSKGEKLAAYEIVITTSDKKTIEVRISPDGEILEDSGEAK